EQVIKETTAFLLTSAMQDVVTSGTGTAVNFGGTAIAAKTGTTSDENDVWLCGFTNYYTATCWAGYDNNENLTTSAETHLAKTLWRKVMSEIHTDLPSATFEVPSGITTATVCTESGLLPVSGLCDGTLGTEYFENGTVPTENCNVHIYQTICNYSGLAATDLCPFKVQQVVTVVPEEPDILKQSAGAGATTTTSGVVDPTVLCPHNESFFAQPNAQEILVQQNQEIINRNAAAAAAAGTDSTTTDGTTTDQTATPEATTTETTPTDEQQNGE
uniref:penicillin-binding transpeptidase domain-containing protein n=1 Tax=Butyrivibrio sp. TaxID=28121 RepID=UPI0025FE44D4